jgi:hypothetical protein
VRVADHDAEIGDARVPDGFKAVEEDRLVGDGNELLGAGVGDRPEPRAAPAGEDQSFDGSASFWCRLRGGDPNSGASPDG